MSAPSRRPGAPGRREERTAWTFLAFPIVFFCSLFFLPIFLQLWSSLFNRRGVFVGIGNFTRAAQDPNVLSSFVTTLFFAAGSLAIGIVLGMLLALILNQALPGRTVIRAILLIPYLTSISIVGLLWRNLLDPQIGIINRVLGLLHLPRQQWLTTHPLATIIGISVWSTLGYTMVLFLAGLQGIPPEYYEAARVDGASVWQRFWQITLPLLQPTTIFVSIIGVIGALQQFALPYIVTNGGPGDATSLYAYRAYTTAFGDNNFGYASALSFLLLIVILVLSVVQLRVGRVGDES